ncbi:response regulator transcription factor [Humibacter ginsenosidimutans]|nr:helix-turn-helix transcriptional regulator [Humibacter ginsenosidimutans]
MTAADVLDILSGSGPVLSAAVARDVKVGSILTPQERVVLALIAEAFSNVEIAAELRIAVGTVRRHANTIYRKLGAKSRVDAVRTAYAIGLTAHS